MNWADFNRNYIVEASISGSVDVSFEENTSIYAVGTPTITRVQHARVLNRDTFQTEKEYSFDLDYKAIRSVRNQLRDAIIQDFQIEEIVDTRLNKNITKIAMFSTNKPEVMELTERIG